ncbi:hypothetical protein O181_079358, partial [Austropuccinia psidii MF-1]|nr:hypothetical protein [Austropuccinia psidii MF-1]
MSTKHENSDGTSHGSSYTSETSFSSNKENWSSNFIKLILCFMAWLHLVCGLSRQRCGHELIYLFQLIEIYIRTTLKILKLVPQLQRHVCCPRCYCVYDMDLAPFECGYKEFSQSSPCGEALLVPQAINSLPGFTKESQQNLKNSKRSKHQKPFSTYTTQSFSDWLTWFIPQAEASIDDWKKQVQSESNLVSDYQKSPAWKQRYPLSQKSNSSAMLLSFSLFADWFNPLMNKLAGKKVSLGILALNCFNLPPTTQWKFKNTFMYSLIPAPNQPNPITINNILRPFVDELIELQSGINIPTPKFPKGRNIIVKLGCLIGDLVATHKVAGYASHSATFFCTWCECTQAGIGNLEASRLCVSRIVKDYSRAFKDARNQTEADRIVKKSGIRWSELNRLPYWDPVQQTSLGIMHMWFEGILQNHFVNRWCFIFSKNRDKYTRNDNNESDQSSDGNDRMEIDESLHKISGLSNEQLIKMKSLLSDVILPSGITRVPPSIGTFKGGKIKSSEWQSLFCIYLPLVVLEVFLEDVELYDSNSLENRLLLKNICALICCTNILASHLITEADGKLFLKRYKTYCKTSQKIFSNFKMNPNDHYALHVKSQLSWWGPLTSIWECSGERLNGFLQSFQNNGQTDKFGLTLMKSFCQWQRLVSKNILLEKPKKKDASEADFSLDRTTYICILLFLQLKDPTIQDY